MSFISLSFVLLVGVGLLAYYILPGRFQWLCLLLVSYVFYFSAVGISSFWLLGVTGLSYVTALALGGLNSYRLSLDKEARKSFQKSYKARKRLLILVEALGCFGLLFLMKYWNFTADLLQNAAGAVLPRWDFLIPLGLSFYIFQSVGYVIDVSRGQEPEGNPFKLALFTSFFPQLIQGPIGRWRDLAPQLLDEHRLDWSNVQYGIQLAMWGYLKKLVIADRAAVAVTAVFDHSGAYGGAVIAASVFLYCIQLYCDFSGGIDIARGVARMFGIDMAENFRRPFFATSLTDYWRRWHITLGAWMRDYLFYPLSLSSLFAKLGKWGRKHIGGKAGKILPTSLATFIVYFVIGMWHGANFRYIAFGLWNGILITSSLLLESRYYALRQRLQIPDDSRWLHAFRLCRTLLLVFIGRYLTRAPSFLVAVDMLWRTVSDIRIYELWNGVFASLGMSLADLIIILAGMAIVLLLELYQERGGRVRDTLANQKPLVQWLAIILPLGTLLLLGLMREGYTAAEFIYKQF